MKTITLPNSLKPKGDFPLIRLGSPRDGGYLIDKRLLSNDLLSFGISSNWQFEKDWKHCSTRDSKIAAFDGSIGAAKFLTNALASSSRLYKPGLMKRNWFVLYDYFRFLKRQTMFERKFVTHEVIDERHETFSNALWNYGLEHPVFLKMDIEGGEYDLLDVILEHQKSIAGMAIEFHNPLTNIKSITAFVTGLDLNITNVHINNCLPKDNDNSVEPSIEISLTNQPSEALYQGHPHPLERDNDVSCHAWDICFR